jgi:hypothetical protein
MFVHDRCRFDRRDPATMNEGVDVIHAVISGGMLAEPVPVPPASIPPDKKTPATR